ncbi:S9 family peptidase [Microbacterium hominis]|uniref:S9 family peptidase n=1 Tax=Microbacterium hominis TaxID=162426 RepID=A0A7D4PMS0_9MICO|nr:prolyl oligopeptidase family serine peptidase [Microbacterium hominis]QKJ19795.1 S9 family peptidase [Microbacterium hominis]
MSSASPYGSWPSPLSAADVAASSPRIEGARFVGDEVWWGETVPHEGGRTTVRRREGDAPAAEVLPMPWSARSRVHEYGGGAWTATDDGTLLFVEKSDQRIYAMRPGDAPRALTPPADDTRYGGLTWQQGTLIAVQEVHGDGPVPRRALVSVGLGETSRVTELVADSVFLAQPALSPGATHLAWVAWDHPHMPWDRTEVRVGRLEEGTVIEWTTVVGGGAAETAPLQPAWLGPDDLLVVDDPTGRWNLWRVHLSADLARRPVAPADADTGGALWGLGLRWHTPISGGRIVAVRTDGADEIAIVDAATGAVAPVSTPLTSDVNIEDASGSRVLVTGSGAEVSAGLWVLDADRPDVLVEVAGGRAPWGREWMPRPQSERYDGPHGVVHAFRYPPTNPDVVGPDDERPPYILFVHGGPTGKVGPAASARIAYFTSRGIGVLDVNYGGSTGYGRAYRERLRGQWGVVDVDDVIAVARGAAAAGHADPARLAIAGGSAGGWTVLCAVTRSDVFAAGISRYGVADLRRLAADTHDFEARYLDSMVGPLPEAEHRYIERSPLSRLESLQTPMLLEQGLDDLVVPPSQSEAVRDALAANGVAHRYLAFEGEGHGFRRADTVVQTLEAEIAFLGSILGFTPAGSVDLASV